MSVLTEIMTKFIKISSKKLLFATIVSASTAFVGPKNNRLSEEQYFTKNQVREFDGRNGKPTFVTFRGGVYDISKFKKGPVLDENTRSIQFLYFQIDKENH